MGDGTSATKVSTPTKGATTEKSTRPSILKRKSTPGNPSLLGSARTLSRKVTQESKPDMAASFLQFCAMCEKQIMTPCNSILYCSEACRRKDSIKPLAAAIINTPSSPVSPPPSEPPSPRQVLSPRLPTGVTLTPRSSTNSIPTTDLHDHKSDLDPTEWKPKLPERSQSEAFRYLSRFHKSISGSDGISSASRSMYEPNTPVAPVTMTTPSLGNTPTTTASSSLSTSAGLNSRHSYGYSYSNSSSVNGYDFNTRPLPTRQNRWYSYNGGTPKGLDLVTPHVVPPMPAPVNGSVENIARTSLDDEGLKWEKRKVMFAVPVTGDDGLSILFADRK